jgi:hypothetical protein
MFGHVMMSPNRSRANGSLSMALTQAAGTVKALMRLGAMTLEVKLMLWVGD